VCVCVSERWEEVICLVLAKKKKNQQVWYSIDV
jgi:hypothetical protein